MIEKFSDLCSRGASQLLALWSQRGNCGGGVGCVLFRKNHLAISLSYSVIQKKMRKVKRFSSALNFSKKKVFSVFLVEHSQQLWRRSGLCPVSAKNILQYPGAILSYKKSIMPYKTKYQTSLMQHFSGKYCIQET